MRFTGGGDLLVPAAAAVAASDALLFFSAFSLAARLLSCGKMLSKLGQLLKSWSHTSRLTSLATRMASLILSEDRQPLVGVRPLPLAGVFCLGGKRGCRVTGSTITKSALLLLAVLLPGPGAAGSWRAV